MFAGLDEAGRGSLAGPVVAAAVILPVGYVNPAIRDSKQLSPRQREVLATVIKEHAIAYAIAEVSAREIDELNILNATFKAMHLAVDGLSTLPSMLLIDGNRFTPYEGIPHRCIIGGDRTDVSIAAASILAKTYRDELMVGLAAAYPLYNWHNNKGYATRDHRRAIISYGYTPYHRLTFTVRD